MIDRFVYYCVVIPWGNMPLGVIYLASDLFYVVLRFIIPYRRKVVLKNIENSFPDKTKKQQRKIGRQFYRFFANLFAESIKNLFISEKDLRKRMVVRNPELMDELYKEGKSVILLGSHYNNWEFLITAQNLLFEHQAFGIGMPLSNKFWDKKMTARRERFGMKVVAAANYKSELKKFTEKPVAVLVLGDQNPGKNENCYWTKFLNQETAFFFGAEIMANEFDMPVVNVTIHKMKRGRYELDLELITKEPRKEEYGKITSRYIKKLEFEIRENPEFWLWSHKRWKKKIPESLNALKKNHKHRFEERFRKEDQE